MSTFRVYPDSHCITKIISVRAVPSYWPRISALDYNNPFLIEESITKKESLFDTVVRMNE